MVGCEVVAPNIRYGRADESLNEQVRSFGDVVTPEALQGLRCY